jgi:HEAT repeat protein
MGTRSSAKLNPTRGVSVSITNYELRIKNFRAHFRLIILLCAFCALAENLSAQTLENLAETIRRGNAEQKRSALFEIRNRQSEEASRIALPALRDADEIVRATAAFAVIFLPSDEAFGALAPNLQDKAEIVRRETAYALGKIQNPSAVAPLVQTFQKDKSVEVRNACVIALGETGDATAVDFLTGILKQKPSDANEFLRRSAARSIGQIAQMIQIKKSYTVTPESFLPEKYKLFTLAKYENLSAVFPSFNAALPVLTEVLQNAREADDTKREAAFALGTIGDAAALPVLEIAARSKDYYLAEIARESIKKLSRESGTE